MITTSLVSFKVNVNITNALLIFDGKKVRIFCILTFLQQINSVFAYVVGMYMYMYLTN